MRKARKKKQPWWKRKKYVADKRVRAKPEEIIVGPEPLTVFYDGGKLFRKDANALFAGFKRAKSRVSRKILWDLILEGKYDWYLHVVRMHMPSKRQRASTAMWRKKWQSRRLSGLIKLRKTAYAYLQSSETLSTIPT